MSLNLPLAGALIFYVPGIIATGIVYIFSPFEDKDKLLLSYYSLLYALSTHIIIYILSLIYTLVSGIEYASFLCHYNADAYIPPREIICCFAISLILGIVSSIIRNKNILSSILLKFNISNSTSSSNVFNCIMINGLSENKTKENIEKTHWVNIYNYANNIRYKGYIKKWDMDKDKNGVLLIDASVYHYKYADNDTPDEEECILNSPALYIPNALKDYVIDFYAAPKTNYGGHNETK